MAALNYIRTDPITGQVVTRGFKEETGPRCAVMGRNIRCGAKAEWYFRAGSFWLCRECFWKYNPEFRMQCEHLSTNPLTCQRIYTSPHDGDQRECAKPATHSAYNPPTFFCDDCLHECMEDASPDEQQSIVKLS